MLWKHAILVFAVLGGVLAEEEEDDCFDKAYGKCDHLTPPEENDEDYQIPNAEQLKVLCPGFLEYYECFKTSLDKCEDEISSIGKFIRGAQAVARDLCDENSDLYKDYIQSVACYKSLTDTGENCENRTKTVYDDYMNFLKEVDLEEHARYSDEMGKSCILEYFQMACIARDVEEKCGDLAHSTFLQILHQSDFLEQSCSPSSVNSLNTNFLSSLNAKPSERDLLALAFNTKKK